MTKRITYILLLLVAVLPASHAYRDLEAGTFLTRDPIGYSDGPNVYCYVHCNPITHFDAFGLDGNEITDGENIFDTDPNFSSGEYSSLEMNAFDVGAQVAAESVDAIAGSAPVVAQSAVEIAASTFIPGVGEVMDVATVADPNAPGWARGLSAATLAYSAYTLGVGPNGGAFARAGSRMDDALRAGGESLPSNPVPDTMARVVPAGTDLATLGAPGSADTFVTAVDDIAGLNASDIAVRLTIPESATGFNVIEFSTPQSGVATPVSRSTPGFVGGGQTAGGAREFVIPNQAIPDDAVIRSVK